MKEIEYNILQNQDKGKKNTIYPYQYSSSHIDLVMLSLALQLIDLSISAFQYCILTFSI